MGNSNDQKIMQLRKKIEAKKRLGGLSSTLQLQTVQLN